MKLNGCRTGCAGPGPGAVGVGAVGKVFGADGVQGAGAVRPVDCWKFCQVTGVGVPVGACIGVPSDVPASWLIEAGTPPAPMPESISWYLNALAGPLRPAKMLSWLV